MLLGTTYSHREIDYLKLDTVASFQTLLEMGFDKVRLGIYWDESEPSLEKYNFQAIEKLLKQCDAAKQAVVLTIGMKAPRWPEYYVPQWAQAASPDNLTKPVLSFIMAAVTQLKHYDCIMDWQVENEPLDSSGPDGWHISEDLLAQEVKVVRQLDTRPIHVNLWGDNITHRPDFKIAARLADTVGVDLYYKQPADNQQYHGPNFEPWQFIWWQWRNRLSGITKPLWITELQAEPWEHSNDIKFSPHTPSISAAILKENFAKASRYKPQAIFLWGFEYWLWRNQQGNPDLLNTVKEILASSRKGKS